MKLSRKRYKSDIPHNSFRGKIKLFRTLSYIIALLIVCGIMVVFMCKMDDIVKGRGSVAGQREYWMKAKVRSSIASINFKPGDFVRKGQVLLTLDDRDYQEQCLKLRSSISELKSQLVSEEAALAALKLDPLPKEYRHAEITLEELIKREVRERESIMAFRNLQKSGAVPLVEINRREIDYLHTQGEIKRMTRDVKLIRDGLPDSILRQKKAQIELIKVRIANLEKALALYIEHKSDYSFVAPEDGYISNIPTKIGIYVEPGENIITFAAEGDKKFLASVDEKDIYKIQEGQKVRVKSSQYNYLEHGYFEGVIYAIDELPREVNGSNTYTVRINLKDVPGKPLRLGSTGGVEILTGRDFIFKILFDNVR